MEKTTAIKLAGSVQALANLLNISRPAIYQWKVMIPKMRVFQLQVKKPEWFK
jgi:DNA-binding transcriptional regulator YdaS (Cro superfamily)